MPSTSAKQKKLMAAACNSAKFRKKVGISRKVACEFFNADRAVTSKRTMKRKP